MAGRPRLGPCGGGPVLPVGPGPTSWRKQFEGLTAGIGEMGIGEILPEIGGKDCTPFAI